ncbi:hypothetical protein QJQ45_026018 [Haematococcus lacustris]|nr:hypothetical protein QJQ45_026018 [Haematococcus lacustris]
MKGKKHKGADEPKQPKPKQPKPKRKEKPDTVGKGPRCVCAIHTPTGLHPPWPPSGISPAAGGPSGSIPASGPAAGPSGSSPAAEDPSDSINSNNKRLPADIGSGLANERAFLFDPATQMGMGLDPGAIQAVSAASGVWRADGRLQGFYRSKLTRSQVQHDSGLIQARHNTQRWNGNVKLELQHLEAATPAGTSLVAIQRHVAVTLATWDAVWEEYLHPKWAEQKMRLHGAQEKVLERYFMKLEEEAASVSQQEWGTRKQLVVFFGNAGIGTRVSTLAMSAFQAINDGKPVGFRYSRRLAASNEAAPAHISGPESGELRAAHIATVHASAGPRTPPGKQREERRAEWKTQRRQVRTRPRLVCPRTVCLGPTMLPVKMACQSADCDWPQVIKVPGGAVLRGCKKIKRKLMAHSQLRAGVHSQLRVIASLYVLRILLTCLVGYPSPGYRSAPSSSGPWSQQRDLPVRGMMWCRVVAPRKVPPAPGSSQEAPQPAASEPGPSTPLPAKRSKRTKAEPEAAEPTKGKGKAAKAKPAPQPGRWLDRDCNAALNMQRIGESKWRPLELCWWPEQGKLPAKGKEYPGLRYKRVRDKPPRDKAQPAAAQFQQVEMAEVAMKRHGRAKQLVVFFGAASIGTRGGWGADAVLCACCKVVCRPRGTDQRRGRVVLVDEHRTSQVSSAVNGKQPCESRLSKRRATRPAGWKPPAGQVHHRMLRPAWSQQRDLPVRGIMWRPVMAPRKPPQAPRSSQEAPQPAASEPGTSTPLPAKRSKRTKAEPEAAEPTKGKGRAAKAKPEPQSGRWLDRDCNAALNMQRIGESKWRPLELCYWPEQGKLPAKGKEYPGLGYKRLRDKPPKTQPAEAQSSASSSLQPPAGQVHHRLLRPAWSQQRDLPVRGIMWRPVVAPRKPPQPPRSSQEAPQPAASEPGPSTPLPAKRSKRTKAEPEAAEPTKGKGRAAKAKPALHPGRWLDRDCNAALNMQRIGESRWRPLELCWWPDQGALPAKGKEYPGLGYKRVRDKPPRDKAQPAAAQ